MKRILILTDIPSVSKGLFHPSDFADLVSISGEMEVEICYFEDLIYDISTDSVRIYHKVLGYDIADFDVVYRKKSDFIQHHPISCCMYVQSKGKIFIDTEFSDTMNANAHKLVEHMLYQKFNLPFPSTIIVTKSNVNEVCEQLENVFPRVLKSLTSTRGDHNYLVSSKDEIINIINEADPENTEFALQEYIENDSDYRLLVLGYETKLIIKRARHEDSNTHTNNTSKGAKAALVAIDDIDPSIIELANRAARSFKREIAGVDIMIGSKTGNYYVLEVNRSPQIERGAFVEDKSRVLADYLKNI